MGRCLVIVVRTVLFVALAMVPAASAAPTAAGGANSAGRQAKTLQESVLSRYNDKKYKEAAELIEEFVVKFPTNENIPANLNRLADCYARTGQWEKFDAPLDKCIEKFPGSRNWYFAYAQKLNRLKDLKDADKYLATADALVRKNGDVPLTLGIPRFIDPYGGTVDLAYAFANWNWPPFFWSTLPMMSPLQVSHDWWMDVLAVCQTPEQASQALKVLSKLFSKKPQEIPLEWQLAHVVLMDRAGDTERAAKLLDNYLKPLEETFKDYRAISMLAWRAEFARQAKDSRTVDAISARLLKQYPTCRGLAEPLYTRIMEIAAAGDRYDEFASLTRQYVKSFPSASNPLNASAIRWVELVERWLKLAAVASPQGNQRPAADLLALIEELQKGKSPYIAPVQAMRWKYQLLTMQARFPDAARVAEQLVGDANWGPVAWRELLADADKHESLKTLLSTTRQKRGIPVADPASPAAALLEKVQSHLKEGQERMAEEVAGEMWEKHRADAHTIEAAGAMAGYYFQKVVAEPRDKWANRMMEAYPQHPLTHEAICNQIDAENGRQDYKRMGAVLDTAMAHFPGSQGRWDGYWEGQRVAAYVALKDTAGGTTFVRNRYARAVDAGDVRALAHVQWVLIHGGLASLSHKDAGQDWVAMAARVAGTPMEPLCRLQAYWHFYDQVYYQAPDIQWDEAIAAARWLHAQTLDPDLAWQTQFGEVNILAWKGDAPALAKALAEVLKDGGRQRDMFLRIDVNTVGTTLGKLPRPEEGIALAKRLADLCATPTDQAAMTMLQGRLYQQAGQAVKSSQCYLAVAYSGASPALTFPVFQWGLNAVTSQPQQYNAEVANFLRAAPHAQDVIPELLFQWWHQVPESQANARKTLLEKYGASSLRDTLDDEIAAAQNSKPAKK